MTLRKNIFRDVTAVAVTTLAIFGTGCTEDDRYKLVNPGQIDTEVTLFEDGIAIPVGSTNKISVADLLNADDESFDDFLKTNDAGEYSINRGGRTDLNQVIKELNLNELASTNSLSINKRFSIDVPEFTNKSTILIDKINFKEQINGVDFSREDFPSMLVNLEEAVLDNAFINIDAVFDGLGDSAFDIDMTLTFPDFFTPSIYSIKGQIVNGKFTGVPQKIEKISNIDFTSGDDVHGSVTVESTIKAPGSSIDISRLADKLNISLDILIGDEYGKITISKIKGRFNCDINSSENVKIGDIPESMKREDLCLDLFCPTISFELTGNLGIPASGSIEIVPIVRGQEIADDMIIVDNVVLPYSANPSIPETRKYCICNSKADCETGFEALEADISKLLKRIPDELKVTLKARVDEKQVSIIEPQADYSFDVVYKIDVPLSFGDDFKFSTQTTIDLSSAETLTKMGDFRLKGKAVNSSPLRLSITLDLLDANDSVIVQQQISSVSIEPATTSDIEFYLSPADNTKKIKNARLTIAVTSKPGVVLKNTDSIQLLDLVVTAPEGLTISTK